MANFTKKAIKETFVQMLNDKPLSQITVKELSDKCGINRNTFYYHYTDIPELIGELVKEETDRIISAGTTIDSIETCLLMLVDYVSSQKRAMMHIYNSINRDIFEKNLWSAVEYVVNSYAKGAFAQADREGIRISDSDKDIIVMYYQSLCFGLAMQWMREGLDSDVREDVIRLCELKKGMIETMIIRCGDSETEKE